MFRDNKPLRIGITAKTPSSSGSIKEKVEIFGIRADYFAEGEKYIGTGKGEIKKLKTLFFQRYDALVIPGNNEYIDPAFYDPSQNVLKYTPLTRRTILEIALVKEALKRAIPIFGACAGHQVLNVALGGTLQKAIEEDEDGDDKPMSDVIFHTGKRLISIMYEELIKENPKFRGKAIVANQYSNHKEAIAAIPAEPPIIVISAHDLLGNIKAIEIQGHPWAIGTQFHPEKKDNEYTSRFFEDLVDSIKAIKEQKENKALVHEELADLASIKNIEKITLSEKQNFIAFLKNKIQNFDTFTGTFFKNNFPDSILELRKELDNLNSENLDGGLKKIHNILKVHVTENMSPNLSAKNLVSKIVLSKKTYTEKTKKNAAVNVFFQEAFECLEELVLSVPRKSLRNPSIIDSAV